MEFNSLLNDIWHTAFIFFSLLLFTRFLDKTQIGQLTFHEYISGITIGSIAGSMASSEYDKFWNHYLDLCIFFLLTYLVSIISIKNRPLRKVIEGSPSIIIENGRIIKENMKCLRYDLDELNSQLREKGVFDISEVQYATLEPTGQLSVILKPAFQPVTKGDMNIPIPNITFPIELIMDGQVIEENLTKKNLTQTWLEKELQDRNIESPSNVMYAVIDSKGKLFVSAKNSKQ